MAQLSECPESLKKVQLHMKIATEHDSKDPVISYWCKFSQSNPQFRLLYASPNRTILMT